MTQLEAEVVDPDAGSWVRCATRCSGLIKLLE